MIRTTSKPSVGNSIALLLMGFPFSTAKTKKWVAGLLLVMAVPLLAFVVVIYSSDQALNTYVQLTEGFKGSSNTESVVAWRNQLLNLNPKRFTHGSKMKRLSTINILMEDSALHALREQKRMALQTGISLNKDRSYQPVSVEAEDRVMSGYVKLHGSTSGNFLGKKKSLRIKLDKDEFHGFQTFSLINSKQHNYLAPAFANYVADLLGLVYNQQTPVRVQINGHSKGVYWMEERIDQRLLERCEIKNAHIIKLKNNWLEHRKQSTQQNFWEVSALDGDIPAEVLYEYRDLIIAVKAGESDQLHPYFDLDYMARFEAWRMLFGISHDVMGENLKMVYKEEDSRFYPVARMEGDLNALRWNGGSLLASYHGYHLLSKPDMCLEMLALLNRSEKFRTMKYKVVWELVNDEALADSLHSLYTKHYDLFRYDSRDWHSIREKRTIFERYLPTLETNMGHMREMVKTARAYVNLIEEDSMLWVELIPDAEAPVRVEEFVIIPFDSITNGVHLLWDDGRTALTMPQGPEINYYLLGSQYSSISPKLALEPKKIRMGFRAKNGIPIKVKDYRIVIHNAITDKPLVGVDLNIAVAREGND